MTRSTPSETATTDAPWTTRRLLRWIQEHLEARKVDAPRVCAELLIGHSIGSERLKLYMEPDRIASPTELAGLRELVARAARHEPVQYLVGSWPFFGREFEVAPCTLIPRPATETLVEAAMDQLTERGVRRSLRILDLCSGTGCIGVSIAASLLAARSGPVSGRIRASTASMASSADEPAPVVEMVPVIDLDHRPVESEEVPAPSVTDGNPEVVATHNEPIGPLEVVATDIVEEAIGLIGRNAARHGVSDLVECRCGSLYDALGEDRGGFDLICANPPYVSDSEYDELDTNVRDYEPSVALRGGPEGLDLVRPVIEQAPGWLAPGGMLLVEIADASRDAVLALAQGVSGLRDERVLDDHEGLARVLVAYSAS